MDRPAFDRHDTRNGFNFADVNRTGSDGDSNFSSAIQHRGRDGRQRGDPEDFRGSDTAGTLGVDPQVHHRGEGFLADVSS